MVIAIVIVIVIAIVTVIVTVGPPKSLDPVFASRAQPCLTLTTIIIVIIIIIINCII